MKNYDHQKIEPKWRKIWDKTKLNQTKDDYKKPKFYILDMFPYPSGEGLHVGHPRGYIATDVYSRYKKMHGFNVLHPMGWDAFGLPAENHAIKNKTNPTIQTVKNVKRYKEQTSIIGFNYDWDREINTTDPKYYKWTQWIFLKLLEKGLAYESFAPINWCPSCKTGLANEDLEDGKCERCGSVIEKKPMRQWVLKITDYADRLLKDIDALNWPESIKESQRNWIGRSDGAEIEFKIKSLPPTPSQGRGEIQGYQTANSVLWKQLQEEVLRMRKNPTKAEDMLWQALRKNGNYHFRRQHVIDKFIVDFLCLSKNLVIEVDGDIHDLQKERDEERTDVLNKLGYHVIRFLNKEVIDNVDKVVSKINNTLEGISGVLPLGEDLGGASASIKVFTTRPDTLFGVTYVVLAPENKLIDELKSEIKNWSEVEKYRAEVKGKTEIERTAENKTKTGVALKGITVINPANNEEVPVWVADYVLNDYGTGAVMAVPAHDERDFEFAKKYNLENREIELEDKQQMISKYGKAITKYKLKDWVFSRQRYWGEPIPVVHCEKCGVVPVPERVLPVMLPKVKFYEPTGTGESPLADIAKWVNTKCPKCKGKAKRETNTMPQWAGSSWYYLRYMDPKNNKALVDPKKEKYWAPVDLYVGGTEHATRHLIYARFWHKFLYDIGAVSTIEPFTQLKNQGMILGSDNRKMSKRWGNVVNPDEVVKNVGADTLRVYEMFMGPFEQEISWSTDNMVGSRRFLERVWKLQYSVTETERGSSLHLTRTNRSESFPSRSSGDLETLLHKTIKKVTEDILSFNFNTVISAFMILVNAAEKTEISKTDYEIILKLLAPFAPHMTEEIWANLGHKKSIHLENWPDFDPQKLISENITVVVQINGKARSSFEITAGSTQVDVEKKAMSLPEVSKWLVDKKIKKIMFIKEKILSIILE
jgi:leucyl-tRNA synthetase